MADGTRLQEIKKAEEVVRFLKENSDKQAVEIQEIKTSLRDLVEIKELITGMSLKYDQISQKVLRSPPEMEVVPQVRNPNHDVLPQFNTRFARIDFPKFSGEDPSGWVYKCERFFYYNMIENNNRVKLATLHLEGKALNWYQWFEKCHGQMTWVLFKDGIVSRFGPNTYEDVMGDLTKLRHTTTVRVYQEQFEELANRTTNLPESFFISCFISGLKEEVKAGVQMFRPTTITQAIGLAKLQENSIEAITKKTRSAPSKPDYTVTQSTVGSHWGTTYNGSHRRENKTFNEKRAKGLCFKCNEKWSKGHECKKKQLFALEGDGEDLKSDQEGEEESDGEQEKEEEELQISLNAITGSVSFRTMRVRGNVKKRLMMILIDSGSTHNFLSPEIVKRTGCLVDETEALPVMVADGTMMHSKAVCKNFEWQMQGTDFKADMRVLPLQGCDMVLGIQWLSTLGPITWDFQNLCMEFHLNGKKHVLRGGKKEENSLVGSSKMNRILKKSVSGVLAAQIFSLHVGDTDVQQQDLEMKKMLDSFEDIFQEPIGLPPMRPHDHHIPLKSDAEPTSTRPYRYPYFQKNEIEKIVAELLKSGVIRNSVSPFSSPVLLVRKKDAGWRMCVDYRALNKVTIKDKFPIPIIDELLDELNGATFFSKLDLRSGYHQIRVHSPDIPKTAFRTHAGHYEFLVMPFGLTNAPSTFQSLMNEIFKNHLRKFILVFFDDILVYSKTWLEHLQHLNTTLQILKANQLYAKMTKCVFGKQMVEYLGHMISNEGVSAESTKIEAMTHWPVPTDLKQLRGFLGLTGYYRRFVRNYGKISEPLTQLLRKDSFHWIEAATQAFEQLKTDMVTTPILALPDYTKEFVIESDASGKGLGAVLMQEGHPIAFWSKVLSLRDQVLSTYEKELMAVVLAVLKWRHYLLGRHFIIRTDHQSLKHLLEQRVATPFQQKWITKLLGFDYEIVYKVGKENLAADALSRKGKDNNGDATLQALSVLNYNWLAEVKLGWFNDPAIQALIQDLLSDPASHKHYVWHDQLLTYKGKVVVGDCSVLKKKILTAYYNSSVGGHSGIDKTTRRIKRTLYWKNLKNDVISTQ